MINRRSFFKKLVGAVGIITAPFVVPFLKAEETTIKDQTVNNKIKYHKLSIRNEIKYRQILMQLHDKGVISTKTLCEEIGLSYDEEIKRLKRICGKNANI